MEEIHYLEFLKQGIKERGYDLRKVKQGDDLTLLRFLKAKKFDVNKALKMYLNFLEWRRENDVDSILEDWCFPEVEMVLELWPQIWHKTDKAGKPVNIHLLGELQVSELFKVTSEERLLRQAIWMCEELTNVKLPACTEEYGRPITSVTVILDLHNLSFAALASVPARKLIYKLLHLFTNYYPELLGNLLIVNAPHAFLYFWELIAPMLDEGTKKKIKIFEDDGLTEILDLIDVENYPSFMGGTCECANGCDVDCAGPWNHAYCFAYE